MSVCRWWLHACRSETCACCLQMPRLLALSPPAPQCMCVFPALSAQRADFVAGRSWRSGCEFGGAACLPARLCGSSFQPRSCRQRSATGNEEVGSLMTTVALGPAEVGDCCSTTANRLSSTENGKKETYECYLDVVV